MIIALQGHRIDVVALYLGEELRVIDGRRLAGAHAELAENREQNDCQRDPQENLFRQIVQVSPTAQPYYDKGPATFHRIANRTYTIPNCRANR